MCLPQFSPFRVNADWAVFVVPGADIRPLVTVIIDKRCPQLPRYVAAPPDPPRLPRGTLQLIQQPESRPRLGWCWQFWFVLPGKGNDSCNETLKLLDWGRIWFDFADFKHPCFVVRGPVSFTLTAHGILCQSISCKRNVTPRASTVCFAWIGNHKFH